MAFMTDSLDLPAAQERGDFAELSIAVVAGLAFAVTALFMFAMPLAGHMAGSRDFVAYWATGQQLVHHANPYDRNAVMEMEHSVGLAAGGVLMMRNPPWALPLAYLSLGFLGLRVAAVLWSLALLCMPHATLLSMRIVRVLHGSPPNRIHWLALSFTPALICLVMGQTSLFALLGLVLFLRYHRTRPYAAGLSLWLCMLKPHLFLPFAAALAAWIVFSRAWKLLAGAAAALALSSAAASLIDPNAWLDYTRLMRSPAVENEFIPCLSSAIRQWIDQLFDVRATWLQYLPAALPVPLGACLLLASPPHLGLENQRQPSHAGLSRRRALLLVLRSVPGHSRCAPRRLRHALPQPSGRARARHLRHGHRNLRRPRPVAVLSLDRPSLVHLVSLRNRAGKHSLTCRLAIIAVERRSPP